LDESEEGLIPENKLFLVVQTDIVGCSLWRLKTMGLEQSQFKRSVEIWVNEKVWIKSDSSIEMMLEQRITINEPLGVSWKGTIKAARQATFEEVFKSQKEPNLEWYIIKVIEN
jgi:hypothetical protein